MSYRERPSAVPGAVLWTSTSTGAGVTAVLPDGCMDLIHVAGGFLVAGPDTVVHEVARRPGEPMRALRFAPGHAPALLGVPAAALRDTRVDLTALWPDRDVRRAADAVAAHGLEEFVLGLARGHRAAVDPLVDRIAAAAAAGTPAATVAAATGYGPRQLHRICTGAFGYGFKTLTRTLRLQRALFLARQGDALASVAARAGYADQAHLTREVRALTGVPPRRLLDGVTPS